MKLKDLGERELIRRIFSVQDMHQEKDDCAMLENGDEYLLVSSDIVSDITNIPRNVKPESIGKFFAAVNLSDIAAMAGIPTAFVSSISIDPDAEWDYLNGIEDGMHSMLRKHKTELIGGDLKEGSGLTLTGTVLGHQKKSRTRKRSDILAGQRLGVTNELGKAGAAYVFYSSGYMGTRASEMLINVEPRIREGQIISEYGGKFLTDLSDGVASAAVQANNDFGLGFKLVEHDIPVNRHVKKAAEISGRDSMEIALGYGGDYELLFTVDNANVRDFLAGMESNGINVSLIGEVWKGNNILFDGDVWKNMEYRGFEHFTNAAGKEHLGSLPQKKA